MTSLNSTRGTGRTPVAHRVALRGVGTLFSGVSKANAVGQVIAGVTLLAIAVPEQLATAQLAGVPAFSALIAFIAAAFVFSLFGSNPIVSVGADSTIAPLFAVALLRLALPATPQYYELVAMTALVTGVLVLAVGLLKLGWLADFLSLPLVTGFLSGIGVIIIVHQLPHVLGVSGGGETVLERLNAVAHQLGHVSAWSIVIAVGTLVAMLVGEKVNAKLPWALAAVLLGTVVASVFSLSAHGVQELGTVVVGLPVWRLRWLSVHEWSAVVTTSLTLVVVIMSQSAATARTSADELGIADDLSRDFVGIGLANVASGLLGTIPVDASPARTTVTGLAGGRTKLPAITAGLGALALSPLITYAHLIPLASLSGIFLFVAGRIIKIDQLKAIFKNSRTEFALALVTTAGVIVLGVEAGLAIAVGLAILTQTWRSARPTMIELGRRRDTTSWEPLRDEGVERVDHLVVVFFEQALFFANAGVFRREIHDILRTSPEARHLIIDAAAIPDVDYTALVMLTQVVADLQKEQLSVTIARANERVKDVIAKTHNPVLTKVSLFESVDDAAHHAMNDVTTDPGERL